MSPLQRILVPCRAVGKRIAVERITVAVFKLRILPRKSGWKLFGKKNFVPVDLHAANKKIRQCEQKHKPIKFGDNNFKNT